MITKKTLTTAAVIVGVLGFALAPPAAAVDQIVMDSASIPKFVNQLPMLELEPDPATGKWNGGLPVLLANPAVVSICEFQTQILPPPLPPTTVWGYQIGDTCVPDPGHSYIGPVVVAQRGTPTQMTFINQLGNTAGSDVLAYTQNTDQTMHWADPLNAEENLCSMRLSEGDLQPHSGCELNYAGPIAAAVHLHGGEIPPNLDGGPDSWFTGSPDGNGDLLQGHGYYTREVSAVPTNPPAAGYGLGSLVRFDNNPLPDEVDYRYFRNDGTWTEISASEVDRATYVYPNTQEAANIWFHDHVLGMTRLNVYAGIAGAYVIQDPAETNSDLGPVTNLVPIVIQDRFFDENGELFFSDGGTTDEHPFWVPEFIGDVAVVNGAAWPTMTVEPKRYRFLFLNGSNSRGYDLSINSPGTATTDPLVPEGFIYGAPGPDMYVIGTDGGYLDNPAIIKPKNNTPGNPSKLVLLPGERYEVIVDFTNFAGQTLEMQNTAWNPYPFGDAPPIAQMMQFQVTTTVTNDGMGVVYDPATGASPRMTPVVNLAPLAKKPDVRRQLTLNEVESTLSFSPLEALLNNTKWDGYSVDQTVSPYEITSRGDFIQSGDYSVPTWYSEFPDEGSMEVWEIINITADAHPIHLHLVQFQILERQPFDPVCYNAIYNAAFPAHDYQPGYGPPYNYNVLNGDGAVGGNPAPSQCYVGKALKTGDYERGWKDTAVMYPDQVTKIAVRFAPTDVPKGEKNPANLIYPFNPDDGHGYVWHCHILDHEDNEMMRPTEVLVDPAFNNSRSFVRGIDY